MKQLLKKIFPPVLLRNIGYHLNAIRRRSIDPLFFPDYFVSQDQIIHELKLNPS